jgi:hypothetical protein
VCHKLQICLSNFGTGFGRKRNICDTFYCNSPHAKPWSQQEKEPASLKQIAGVKKSWGEEETIQQIPISTLCILNSYICKRKNKYNWNNAGVKKSREKKKPFNDSTPNSLHANPYSQQEKEPASLENKAANQTFREEKQEEEPQSKN